jgi:hypothetical protein
MKKSLLHLSWPVALVALALSTNLFWTACGEKHDNPIQPETSPQEVILSKENPQVQAVMAVQERHTESLMANPYVVGIGTGMTEDGRPAVLVMLKSEIKPEQGLSKISAIPAVLDGVPVVTLVTGEIKALKSGGSFNPTLRHRPAPNGVSLGHPAITAGTLGCLVSSGGTIYILSNNHVMANENQANIGDDILQPGPFDGGQNPADRIADLSAFEQIVFSPLANNVIDAAIADVVNDNDVTGATHPNAGSYGSPRTNPLNASVGLRVQKYGRTTRHTQGTVQAINATVNVTYGSGIARFVGQIVIGPGGFSAGGDSGSLIVGRGGNNARRPVGLLFAGSSSATIANPIGAVLSEFNVTVVGN